MLWLVGIQDLKLAECVFSNCCSCSIRGWHNTLRGKHYPPTSACMSSQVPMIGSCYCGWQGGEYTTTPSLRVPESMANFALLSSHRRLWHDQDFNLQSPDDRMNTFLVPNNNSFNNFEHVIQSKTQFSGSVQSPVLIPRLRLLSFIVFTVQQRRNYNSLIMNNVIILANAV